MGDQNLRVWPVDGDTYGDVIEYPANARTRLVPVEPGATGPANTDLVVTARSEPGTPVDDQDELGRHRLVDVLVVYPGQPTPSAVLASEQDRTTTVTAPPRTKTPAKAGAATDKK